VYNVEYTNPGKLSPMLRLLPKRLKEHGFDPMNLTNSGLKDKLVAVYPASLKDTIPT
jgi:hypothetical protein